MPQQTSSLDETNEKHANGNVLEKKAPAQQQNGNLQVQRPNEKVEENDEDDEELPTADVVVPTGE